jgi:hypothetical protein
LHTVQIVQALIIQNAEEVEQLIVVGLETALNDLLSLKIGQVVDHLGALLSLPLNH